MSLTSKQHFSKWSNFLSNIKHIPAWLSDSIVPTKTSIKFRLFIVVVFVLVWVYYTLHAFVSHLMSNPFNIGEWLINYEAGFVRRGLLGSFTLVISDFFSVSPSFVAAVMQSSIAALVLALLFLFLTRSDTPLLLFICMMGPMGFTYFLTDHAVVGRKEIILYGLSLLWILYISGQNKGDTVSALEWFHSVAFTGLFIFSILAHEGFIFFMPILLWLSLIREERQTSNHHRKAILRVLPFVISTVITIPVLLVASNKSVGSGMCDAITLRGADQSICDGGINLASQSGVDALVLVADFANLPAWIIAYGPVLIVLGSVLSIYLGRHQIEVILLGRTVKTRRSLTVLFVLASPIFILSVDWGRYLSIFFSLTSLGLLFLYQQKTLARAQQRVTHPLRPSSPRIGGGWGVPIIGVYYLFFGVSHIGGVYQPLLFSAYEQALRLVERISNFVI